MSAVIDIKLGGVSHPMRPAAEVYRDVEARINLPMNEILQCAIAQRLTLAEASVIVWQGCTAGGARDFSIEAVEKRLFEERFSTNPQILGPIIKLMLALLYVPKEAQKKYVAEVQPVLEAMATT